MAGLEILHARELESLNRVGLVGSVLMEGEWNPNDPIGEIRRYGIAQA